MARKARASCEGAAIANGSSSVVTRSSPRKNDDRLHWMNSFWSGLKPSPRHCSASSEKSNCSELQCWFSQREKSLR